MTVSDRPAPLLTLPDALDRLNLTGQRFLFFADAADGRGIAPCLFEHEGKSLTPQLSGGNSDLRITIVSGDEDTVCEPWQQKEATTFLQKEGYDTRLVSVPGANHNTLVYQDVAGDQPVSRPDSPAGRRTTQAILDSIKAAGW